QHDHRERADEEVLAVADAARTERFAQRAGEQQPEDHRLTDRAEHPRAVLQEAHDLAVPKRPDGEPHVATSSASSRRPVAWMNTSSSEGFATLTRCTRSPKRSTTLATSS